MIQTAESTAIGPILDKAERGVRISDAEALVLLRSNDLPALGRAAHAVRMRLHPEPVVTYIVDRNVNYSNVCAASCDFCAFYRRKGEDGAYVLGPSELRHKITELVAAGGVQILMQGGLHPDLKLEWYEDLLRWIKSSFPVWIHGFSPPEIVFFAKLNKLPLAEVLRRLKDAGLDSIPGGGAEILSDRLRPVIAKGKCTADEWIACMREAHRISLRSSATMMFGHVETLEERVDHLKRIRDLQDETGGFTAFIPWTLQPALRMADVPPAGSFEYLKQLAVSRLYLDNVPNMQSSWVTQGADVGSLALLFGANDMGSTMLEENVVKAAGAAFRMSETEIRDRITRAGFTPKARDNAYRHLE